MNSPVQLDCCGHFCPVPIIMTEEKLLELKPGEVLEVVFTDPGAKPDLQMWCKVTGNKFLEFRSERMKYFATIRKK